eukprot:767079-Hanusia_phi.AAC.2
MFWMLSQEHPLLRRKAATATLKVVGLHTLDLNWHKTWKEMTVPPWLRPVAELHGPDRTAWHHRADNPTPPGLPEAGRHSVQRGLVPPVQCPIAFLMW